MNLSNGKGSISTVTSTATMKSGEGSDQFPAGLRVLVVDDDPTCLMILEKMLRTCLYEVTKCNRAETALSLLRENKNGFDIVISDVHMPDMDGFKLLEHIGLEMDLPVIMMSADDGKSVVMKGVTHGACDYLIKPVRIEALKNIWQHVVRKKKNEWKDTEQSGSADEGDRHPKASDDGDYSSSANEGNWRNSRKRRDDEEDGDDRDDSSTLKKPRVVWSVELHQQFVAAVDQLGIDKAVPKKILELMNVPGLTRENVASHLQKYRLYLRRLSGVSQHNNLNNSFLSPQEASFGTISPMNGLDLQTLAAAGQLPAQSLATLQAAGLGRSTVKPGLSMPLMDQRNLFSFENPRLRFGEGQQQLLSSNKPTNLLHGVPTNMEPKQLANLHQSTQSLGNLNMRVTGSSTQGNPLLMQMFEPYFYISCPPGMRPDDISRFHQVLEARMREANRNSNVRNLVIDVQMVQRRSIMYYQQLESQPFLKIIVALPTMVASCRGILDRGIQLDGLGMKSFMTYESNVLFALRFMIDCNIVGGNWIEIPVGKYKKTTKSLSYCQLEFDCLYSDLISHAPEGEYSKMAPFRILSFDIECAGRKGHFPEPTHDPVIQIANLVTLQGEGQPLIRNVMTLNSCSPIVGVDVMSFDTEEEVLLAWRDFIREVDPDIIIGYNICKFDLPYLIERAAALKIADFPILGRIRNSRVRVKDTTFSSRQYGIRESKEVTVEGRVQFDLLQVMQRDYKLSSYSLNSVSAHFLSEQKEDVHHSIISDLQNGSAETRRRLAVYCLKDAYLPQRLLDKLMFVYNYVEMARVTGVPISFLLSRGQSIKVLSQLLRKAKQKNLVIPNAKQAGSEQGTFEGATVLEARAGFYEKPIATLDFASLYPSIMMAYNLCYCTLVTPENARNLNIPPESVNKTPSGETFVKSNLQKGILPEILEELLAARKRAKADLKEAKDPLEKAVLDGRQLALKISANSVYGFTGATIGQLPCLEISSSVTSYGRQMIEHTKKLVEDKFTTLNGYEHNAEVIYGDTDSVMVQFGASAVDEAMNLGREAAEYISGTFIKPIKLEFEKIYFPYLLISKKRYAGLFWTKPDNFDKMDTKGIETVRRDNCLLVKNLVNDCLHKILIDRDVPGAVQYVKNAISDLLMNRMDLSLLVITKGLTKTGDDYEVKTAHVELAERMRKRDAATAPNVGDRVPYVIIKAAKGAKAYEKSEDPIYVLENNIPIDPHYYLENQISKPILRIFEPILKNASKELLHGDHTRSISISTPSNSGIMRFAKKQYTCIGCKAVLSGGNRTLCSHCKGREAELYCKSVAQVSDLEILFGRLWTQCQECQGSLHQDVLCTSRDCPIFYRRKKAQKDMAEARLQLDRWSF